MGLIPPEDVPAIHILTSPDLSDPEHVTAASARTFTIAQIMAAEGDPRDPAYPDTPRDFTLAFIVTQDIPYHDAAYAIVSVLSAALMTHEPPVARSYFNPLYWATGRPGDAEHALARRPDRPSRADTYPHRRASHQHAGPRNPPTATLPSTATELTAAPTPTPTASRPALPCLSAAFPGAMGVFLLARRTRRPS